MRASRCVCRKHVAVRWNITCCSQGVHRDHDIQHVGGRQEERAVVADHPADAADELGPRAARRGARTTARSHARAKICKRAHAQQRREQHSALMRNAKRAACNTRRCAPTANPSAHGVCERHATPRHASVWCRTARRQVHVCPAKMFARVLEVRGPARPPQRSAPAYGSTRIKPPHTRACVCTGGRDQGAHQARTHGHARP
jgi:hypothetical protein